MGDSQWRIAEIAPEPFLRSFSAYPYQVLQVLWNRGLKKPEEVSDFFAEPDFRRLPDPFLLCDMEKAVLRLSEARRRGEHVVVFGDYDADGACGAAVLTELLRALAIDVSSYLPDRFIEGYGLTNISVEEISRRNAALVITVDCGVSDNDEIAALSTKGIDTIVLDHHLVPEQLPSATAVVDAHRNDDHYPFDWLCGAGVAFAFTDAVKRHALGSGLPDDILERMSDLVAVATIADLVPLTGPNRILVSRGLRRLREHPRVGLAKLMAQARVDKRDITSETIAFDLAPRINAASRMDHANTAFALLVADTDNDAVTLAKTLDSHNRARQKKMQEMVAEAEAMVDDYDTLPEVLVVAKEQWSRALVFGVAARLSEKYHRPVFALAVQDGIARGSARSVPGFDLVAAMRAIGGKDLLQEFGGHAMAAGCTVRADWLPLFRERLEACGKQKVSAAMLQRIIEVDIVLQPHEVSHELFSWFERLAPFGKGNPRPRVLVRDCVVWDIKKVGRGERRIVFRFASRFGGNAISGSIFLRTGEDLPRVRSGDVVDVVGELRRGWRRGVEMRILDMRPAA